MAELMKPDGTIEQIEPANGPIFMVDEMQSLITGQLEAIKLSSARVMYHSIEGIRFQLPYNRSATLRLHMYRQDHKYTRLLGNVLVASYEEIGDTEE